MWRNEPGYFKWLSDQFFLVLFSGVEQLDNWKLKTYSLTGKLAMQAFYQK